MKVKKLVFGVGINDADYVTQKFETVGYTGGKQKQKLVWRCPYYLVWTSMLMRCYSVKFQEKNPTYAGCIVSNDWLTFSAFKDWMEKQGWEDKHLDKDTLLEGNKIYSPDTCVFVTQTVNKFMNDRGNDRGKWLLGVYWDKKAEKFKSQCRNPLTKKRESLGYYTCEKEAHKAWAKRKLELAHELAAIQTDKWVAKALVNRYEQVAEPVLESL